MQGMKAPPQRSCVHKWTREVFSMTMTIRLDKPVQSTGRVQVYCKSCGLVGYEVTK